MRFSDNCCLDTVGRVVAQPDVGDLKDGRGHAKASFMMDHGLTGPFGLLGGHPGACNEIELSLAGSIVRPFDNAKGDGFVLAEGDTIQVRTPGGGGYGNPKERPAERIAADLEREYFTAQQVERDYSPCKA